MTTTVTLFDLEEANPDDEEWYTDDESWEKENMEDPYPQDQLEAERTAARADPAYLTSLFWAARKAERRYRAAAGRFRPRKSGRQQVGKRLVKKTTMRGPNRGPLFRLTMFRKSRWRPSFRESPNTKAHTRT